MAKGRREQQPKVRKSVLIFAGVALGLTVLAFVYTTVLSGGGGGGDVQAPSVPAESSSDGSSSSNGAAAPEAPAPPAPAPAPEPAAAVAPDANTEQLIAASQASRYTQLVAEGKCQALPPGEPRTLDQVLAHVNGCLAANPLQPAP